MPFHGRANISYAFNLALIVRYQLRARHKALEDRRNILNAAKEQLKDNIISYSDAAMQVTEEELVHIFLFLRSLRTGFTATGTIYSLSGLGLNLLGHSSYPR